MHSFSLFKEKNRISLEINKPLEDFWLCQHQRDSIIFGFCRCFTNWIRMVMEIQCAYLLIHSTEVEEISTKTNHNSQARFSLHSSRLHRGSLFLNINHDTVTVFSISEEKSGRKIRAMLHREQPLISYAEARSFRFRPSDNRDCDNASSFAKVICYGYKWAQLL